MASTVQDLNQTLHALAVEAELLPAEDKKRLVRAAKQLVGALEEPEEVAFRQIYESHTYSFVLRFGVEVGIFRALVSRHGKTISAGDLAVELGVEELLLVRVMRLITSLGYAAESNESEYVATPLTHVMVLPHVEGFAVHSHQHAARVMVHMPQYLQNTGYKSPDDGKNGPFQFAFSTKLAYFEHIHADATRAARFNTCMQGNKGKRRQWFEWFPDMDDLVERYTSSTPKSESERVFLVDLGGGNGHHLQRLLDKFPMLKGDLILQDVPVTISSLSSCSSFSEKGKEGGGIHPMVHDIFSLQPIKGAYLYYTHFVLHDFNDEKCRTLLRQTAKAMTPGYSRLLLNEIVLPERDCPAEFAALDLTMLAVLSGIERTRGHWVRLVEEVGLRVLEVRVSPDEGDREGVVVAEVPIPVQAPV